MWNEIIAKKRWLIIAVISLVVLLLISSGIYIGKKSQKIDEEYGVYYMPYMNDIDSIGSDICFNVTVIDAEYGEINFTYSNLIYNFFLGGGELINMLIFFKKCKKSPVQ